MKLFLILGSINCFLAIALGAFGAHGLKNRLSEYHLSVFETAFQYHFYHALGLLICGIILSQWPELKNVKWVGYLFFVGILLFSGSLYLLSITQVRWLGMITPIGGLLFLAGWLLLTILFIKKL